MVRIERDTPKTDYIFKNKNDYKTDAIGQVLTKWSIGCFQCFFISRYIRPCVFGTVWISNHGNWHKYLKFIIFFLSYNKYMTFLLRLIWSFEIRLTSSKSTQKHTLFNLDIMDQWWAIVGRNELNWFCNSMET